MGSVTMTDEEGITLSEKQNREKSVVCEKQHVYSKNIIPSASIYSWKSHDTIKAQAIYITRCRHERLKKVADFTIPFWRYYGNMTSEEKSIR